uniref:Uncharacterized protein n=1 Tax=Aegilops tauschii subsp. strangulata TaxID=200361 RepID=A0A453J9M7_AEGTS
MEAGKTARHIYVNFLHAATKKADGHLFSGAWEEHGTLQVLIISIMTGSSGRNAKIQAVSLI